MDAKETHQRDVPKTELAILVQASKALCLIVDSGDSIFRNPALLRKAKAASRHARQLIERSSPASRKTIVAIVEQLERHLGVSPDEWQRELLSAKKTVRDKKTGDVGRTKTDSPYPHSSRH